MQTKQLTISDLVDYISQMERQIIQTKAVINGLKISNGEAPLYPDSDLIPGSATGSRTIKKDQFYGKTIHSAMREYLEMRKTADLGPATLNEIYMALCDGGLSFETDNEDNRKSNMRFLLRKNSSIFHRLPDKVHFGLTEWYPNAKREDRDSPVKRTNKKARQPKENNSAPVGKRTKPKSFLLPHVAEAPSEPKRKVTQERAVAEAVDATTGTFKRQEILDWIDKTYPAIEAGKKKASIFAALAKLKDRVETVTEAKGSDPATYRRIER